MYKSRVLGLNLKKCFFNAMAFLMMFSVFLFINSQTFASETIILALRGQNFKSLSGNASNSSILLLGDSNCKYVDSPVAGIQLTPDKGNSLGGAFLNTKLPTVYNYDYNWEDRGFSAAFSIYMGDSSLSPADGFAIVFAGESPRIGEGGGSLGYGGVGKSIAVEYDTWKNSESYDKKQSTPHVAFHYNGSMNTASNSTKWNEPNVWSDSTMVKDLDWSNVKNQTVYCWIDYSWETDALEARFSLNNSRPTDPDLKWRGIYPSDFNDGNCFLGVTSASGDSYQQVILNGMYYRDYYSPIDMTKDYESSMFSQNVKTPVPASLAYTGEEQVLISEPGYVISGNFSSPIQYSLDFENWSSSLPKAKEIGEYIVYYKVEGDNAKFVDYIGSVTASIGKAEQFIQAEDISIYYKDKDKTNYINGSYYTLGSRGEYVFPEMTFTSSNPDIVEVGQYGELTIKNIGTANINVNAAETDVYRAASKTITVNVSKVGQEDYITVPSANRFVYDGNEKTLITPAKNYIGDVYYRIGKDGIWSKDVPVATDPGDYDIYWYLDGGDNYASIGSQEDPAGFVTSKIEYWGELKSYNGIRHYVEYNGKTSVEVSGNNTIWLKEESDGTYAWYGLDNSSGFFQKGSRFSVQWIDSDTDPDEWERYCKKIDDKHKIIAENGKLWIFLVEVVAPDGTKYENFGGNGIPFYVELGPDWDKEDVKAVFIGESEDETVTVDYLDNFSFPGGAGSFAKLMLNHFSPYAVYDSYDSYYSPSSTNYSYSTSNYSTPTSSSTKSSSSVSKSSTSSTKSGSSVSRSSAVKTSDNFGASISFAMFGYSACIAFVLCKKKYIH